MSAALATSRSLLGAVARIELAASRLARDLAAPHARALLHSISCAAAELDRGLLRLAALSVARRHAARTRSPAPAGPILTALCERLAPALAARGLALERGTDEPDAGAAPIADPVDVQRLALGLVRFAAARLAAGGRLRIHVQGADTRGGPVLVLESDGPRPVHDTDAPAGAALRASVTVARAGLEHVEHREGEGRRERLVVRLAAGEEVWSTS